MPSTPDPVAPADTAPAATPNPPATPTPAPTPAPPPAPAATVRVRVAFPCDVFEHGVDGVRSITRQLTEIPASALQQVKDAAAVSRVRLIEEEA